MDPLNMTIDVRAIVKPSREAGGGYKWSVEIGRRGYTAKMLGLTQLLAWALLSTLLKYQETGEVPVPDESLPDVFIGTKELKGLD